MKDNLVLFYIFHYMKMSNPVHAIYLFCPINLNTFLHIDSQTKLLTLMDFVIDQLH